MILNMSNIKLYFRFYKLNKLYSSLLFYTGSSKLFIQIIYPNYLHKKIIWINHVLKLKYMDWIGKLLILW